MIFVCWAIAVFLALTVWQLTRELRRSQRQVSLLKKQYRELEETRNRLVNHAYFDHLTGLANRSLLDDRFQLAIERAKRSQMAFALIMIDLNDFKAVNDKLGHLTGDQLLVAVSRRLVQSVRASDTVARFGGDEFVVIVESNVPGTEFIGPIALKLIDVLGAPISLSSGQQLTISASIGCALYPRDGETQAELLSVADRAMYHCKTSGMMPLFQQ